MGENDALLRQVHKRAADGWKGERRADDGPYITRDNIDAWTTHWNSTCEQMAREFREQGLYTTADAVAKLGNQ